MRIMNTQPITTWEDININRYYYETNNKFIKWLLNKLIEYKLIIKKECIEKNKTISYEEINIDTKKIEEFIIEHTNKMYALNLCEVEKILIGSRYLQELKIQITQDILLPYMAGHFESFRGIPLVLCPYIDGIVFVPKDKI